MVCTINLVLLLWAFIHHSINNGIMNKTLVQIVQWTCKRKLNPKRSKKSMFCQLLKRKNAVIESISLHNRSQITRFNTFHSFLNQNYFSTISSIQSIFIQFFRFLLNIHLDINLSISKIILFDQCNLLVCQLQIMFK